MTSRLDLDPFYRAILADLADTEWRIVEQNFIDALRAAPARSPAAPPDPQADAAPPTAES